MDRKSGLSVAEIFGVLGAIASILGVVIWLSERDGAKEISALREAELINLANSVLVEEGSDGQFDYSPDIRWALRVLTRFGQTAEIKSDNVELMFADLRCASVNIEARSVSIQNSFLQNTNLTFEAAEPLEIENSLILDSNIISFTNPNDLELLIADSYAWDLSYNNWSNVHNLPELDIQNSILEQFVIAGAGKTFRLDSITQEKRVRTNEELCNQVDRAIDKNNIEFVDCLVNGRRHGPLGEEAFNWIKSWGLLHAIFENYDPDQCLDRTKIDISLKR